MSGLAGSRVLVTGAYRGIGAACAKSFAEIGAHVACGDIRMPEETEAAIRDSGGKAHSYACDVADESSVLTMFKQINQRMHGLDILVHCAGVIHEKSLLDTSVTDFDHVIAVNLRGSFLVGREAIRMMQGVGGRVILTAADLGYLGREAYSSYVASKHGVLGLVRSWSMEFAPNILVNAICPGPIHSEMFGANLMPPDWRARELDIPAARFGLPEEVAQTVLFLAGPGAGFITGQGIGVNGGSVMS